jgi:hypothetical protein
MIFKGPHITKKTYTIHRIEEVEIDAAITTLMVTTPPGEPDPYDPEDPNMPDSHGGGSYEMSKSPNYGSSTYSSQSGPFGDTSRPQY